MIDEPYISPEQNRLFNLLVELSSRFQDLIARKRSDALTKLLDGSSSSESKKIVLNEYFSFRMKPQNYEVQVADGNTYSLPQMIGIAKELNEDSTFYGNDCPMVIDNLDPFFESVTLDDIVLAYHNYRLSKSDDSLSHFVKLIGYYTKYAFEMDGLRVEFPVSDGILSHNESVKYLSSVIEFVDGFLRKYENKRKLFDQKYILKEEIRENLSARIDIEAMQYFQKKQPFDIRISKLNNFVHQYGDYEGFDDFFLSILLDNLYSQFGIAYNISIDELQTYQWPTYDDLLTLAKIKLLQEKQAEQEDSDSIESYKHIIDNLTIIRERNMISDFNAKVAVTKEDFIEADENNNRVETESVFENIQMHIRSLLIVSMAIEEIPEFSSCAADNRWRMSICRKLCDIFVDDDAFEKINDDDRINKYRIVENENRLNSDKAALFRLFLMEYNSSTIDSIMKNRIILLDKARLIAPEDVEFLEECSTNVLKLLQRVVPNASLVECIKQLKLKLNFGNKIQVSDSVITTLATAEFLFAQYANEYYSAQKFDYSSISALYYQAFENAYNELIWGKYADYLNNKLEIDGMKFSEIMNKKELGPGKPGYGYLPSSSDDRKQYTTKIDRTVKVKSTCMYMQFVKIIGDKVYKVNELSGFYEWFANEFSFTSKEKMLENSEFMGLLNKFRVDINDATPRRNVASHGGNDITIETCSQDRRIVLSDLQMIREYNMGLIQQLLGLLNFTTREEKDLV